MKPKVEQLREKFEEWLRREHPTWADIALIREGDGYEKPTINAAWLGFKAALEHYS